MPSSVSAFPARVARMLFVCLAVNGLLLTLAATAYGLSYTEVQQIPAQRWDFTAPYGCAVDASGTLWVALANHLEGYNSDGNLVATSNCISGALLLDGDAMWGLSASGLTKIDRDFNVLRTIPPLNDGRYHDNQDFAVGGDGRVFQTDNAEDLIRVYDATGTVVSSMPLQDAQCVAVDGSDHVVATRAFSPMGDAADCRIVEFSPDGSEESSFACQNSSGIVAPPKDIVIADDGTLLVAVPRAIWHFARNGAWLGVFAEDPLTPSNYGGRLQANPDGTYCWCEVNGNAVSILDHDGKLLKTVGARVNHVDWFSEIGGIAFDAQGNGYVSDQGFTLHKFSFAGEIVQSIPLVSPAPGDPVNPRSSGVAVDSQGVIYSADPDYYVQAISRYAPTGEYLGRLYGAEFASYMSGNGLAFGPDGLLYATANMSVLKFNSQLGIAQQWRSAWPQLANYVFDEPIAVSKDGQVLVGQQLTEQTKARVLRYSLDGALLGEFGLKNDPAPPVTFYEKISAIAAAPDGSIFVADSYNARVQHFSAEGEYLDDLSAGWLQPLAKPTALAFDPFGRLWVADGNRLRCFWDGDTIAPGPSHGPVSAKVGKVRISPSALRHGRRVRFSTTITPTSAARQARATLKLYRLVRKVVVKRVGGHARRVKVTTWRLRTRLGMASGAPGVLTASYKLPLSGRWKAVVVVADSGDLVGCSSPSRLFTVK
jgi:sugar lactone lactonase YvrE